MKPDDRETLPSCPHGLDVVPYLQGDLEPRRREEMDRHLAECPICAAAVARFRPLVGELRRGPPTAVSWFSRRTLFRGLAIAAALAAALALHRALAPARLAPHIEPSLSDPLRAPVASAASAMTAAAPAVDPGPRGRAIARALDWLEDSQEPDGRWDAHKWGAQSAYTVGVTALSLLAFLAPAPAPEVEHRAAVERGVEFILREQDESGRFGPAYTGSLYNHALATLAVLEAGARYPHERWTPALRRALRFIGSTQRGSGGWAYERAPDRAVNTSLTVWQVLALTRAAGQGYPEVQPWLEHGLAWLRTAADGDGRVGYRAPGDFRNGYETMTAAAAWCLFGAGARAEDDVLAGRMIGLLRAEAEAHPDTADYYRAYFLTRALRSQTLDAAEPGVEALLAQLLLRQSASSAYAGSWDPSDRWGLAGGRVYATALAVMTLSSAGG